MNNFKILKTKYIKLNPSSKILYNGLYKIKCKICKIGDVVKEYNKYYGFCNTCLDKSSYYSFFNAMSQQLISYYNSRIIFSVGGTNTGKTDGNLSYIVQHLLECPNAFVLVLGDNLPVIKANLKSKIYKFLPDEFYNYENGKPQKSESGFTLFNGSKLLIVASDDDSKYRGLGITLAWMVEANNIPYQVYQFLTTRLRSENQKILEFDQNGNPIFEIDENGNKRIKIKKEFGKIIVEANPDINSWVYYEVLRSKYIFYTKSVRGIKELKKTQNILLEEKKDVITVLSATDDNTYATEQNLKDFNNFDSNYENKFRYCQFITENKPIWALLNTCEIKNNFHNNDYFHYFSFDWGTSIDNTLILESYLDPELNKLIIYKGTYFNNKSIKIVTNYLNECYQKYNLKKIIYDPALNQRKADKFINGGTSIVQNIKDLNYKIFNIMITGENKIQTGEDMGNELIKEKLILFDTMGENVLDIFNKLQLVSTPNINDTTKRGLNKNNARIISNNEHYDTFRYLSCYLTPFRIKEELVRYYNYKKLKENSKKDYLWDNNISNNKINNDDFNDNLNDLLEINKGDYYG